MNICDEELRDDIEYFRNFLFSELETEVTTRGLSELKVDEVQLVLEVQVDELGVMCCYYFVNPRGRSLFWLDGWEQYEIFKECGGAFSDSHKGELQAVGHAGFTKRFESIRSCYPSTLLVRQTRESSVAIYSPV